MRKPDVTAPVAFLNLLEDWQIDGHAHLQGTLREHLLGTYELLDSWGARSALCVAGLFHAVDGTQRFSGRLNRDQRPLAEVLGSEVASLITRYATCDRDLVWGQIGVSERVRFTAENAGPSAWFNAAELADFCELTIANELEILRRDQGHRDAYGALFRGLFVRMRPFVSKSAYAYFVKILGERESLQGRLGRLFRRLKRRASR